MARVHCSVDFIVFCFIFLTFSLLRRTTASSQAFIQIDNELRYLVEDVSVGMYESIQEDGTPSRSDNPDKPPSIRFDPPMLDFKQHPVGMPHVATIRIFNPSEEHTISMLSISGSTVHFHCTFFQEKLIPPLGNTSLEVVFLGRDPGPVESYIYIHSSVGSFRFRVQATGIPNPYRLKPLVGVKMPLNSSYTPLIEMYNPHTTPLQVLEMYSSGGDLHLELPGGGAEADGSQWQLAPYSSRQLIRASFVARQENNHTAFIRIKTNSTTPTEEYLVVPVEVEVTSRPGLFCPLQRVDFGLSAAGGQPKVVWIPLLNAGHKPIHIQHVLLSPANDAVKVEFVPIRLVASTLRSTNVAKVTFHPELVKSSKQLSGRLFIKSKNGQHKLQLAYSAELVAGQLQYDIRQLQFLLNGSPSVLKQRQVNATNGFSTPLAVFNVTLSSNALHAFQLVWSGPTVLGVNQSVAALFTVRLLTDQSEQRVDGHVTLQTNVTELRLPLACYSGKLKPYVLSVDGEDGVLGDPVQQPSSSPPLPSSSPPGPSLSSPQPSSSPPQLAEPLLDFGTLGLVETRHMYFYLLNENAVSVQLQGWGSNLTGSQVELVGTDRGGISDIRRKHGISLTNKRQHLVLLPGCYAVMRVTVVSPNTEGVYSARCFVHTEYERLSVPFQLRVARGSLTVQPESLLFHDTFPGGVWTVPLSVHSAFSHSMSVLSVRAVPHDQRLHFQLSAGLHESEQLQLQPGGWTRLGQLQFRPADGCGDTPRLQRCYTSFQLHSKRGVRWLQGLSLPRHVGDLDSTLFHGLRSQFQWTVDDSTDLSQKDTGAPAAAGSSAAGVWCNLTVLLDTSHVRGLQLPVRAQLSWPQLVAKRRLRFGVSQVNNVTLRSFTVHNPSEHPLYIHLSLLSDYTSTQATMDIMKQLVGESVRRSESSTPDGKGGATFALLEAGSAPADWAPGAELHHNSVAARLPANSSAQFSVVFQPRRDISFSDVVVIRNNLTVLEMVLLQGRGAVGQLKFASQLPGSNSPLVFQLTEEHLKDCTRPSKYLMPNFTVKRAFTARNVGDVPIYITNFSINGAPCEGFGFRVLDCRPLLIAPNASKQVELAFTPDFTMSTVRRRLELHAGLGADGQPSSYRLLATVPSSMLSVCQHAVPRPDWESLLYYIVMSLVVFLVFCALVAGFFEADRIVKSAYRTLPPDVLQQLPPLSHGVFDLSGIGRRISEEMRRDGPVTVTGQSTTPPSPRQLHQLPRRQRHSSPAAALDPAVAAAQAAARAQAEKYEAEAVLRRRKAKKDAKTRRDGGWTSALLATLGMAAQTTVIEDVAAAGRRTPMSGAATDPRRTRRQNGQPPAAPVNSAVQTARDDTDSVSSTTDNTDDTTSEKDLVRDKSAQNGYGLSPGAVKCTGSASCSSAARHESSESGRSSEPPPPLLDPYSVKQGKSRTIGVRSGSGPAAVRSGDVAPPRQDGLLELPYKLKSSVEDKDKKKRQRVIKAGLTNGCPSPASDVVTIVPRVNWQRNVSPRFERLANSGIADGQQTKSVHKSSSFANIVSGQVSESGAVPAAPSAPAVSNGTAAPKPIPPLLGNGLSNGGGGGGRAAPAPSPLGVSGGGRAAPALSPLGVSGGGRAAPAPSPFGVSGGGQLSPVERSHSPGVIGPRYRGSSISGQSAAVSSLSAPMWTQTRSCKSAVDEPSSFGLRSLADSAFSLWPWTQPSAPTPAAAPAAPAVTLDWTRPAAPPAASPAGVWGDDVWMGADPATSGLGSAAAGGAANPWAPLHDQRPAWPDIYLSPSDPEPQRHRRA